MENSKINKYIIELINSDRKRFGFDDDSDLSINCFDDHLLIKEESHRYEASYINVYKGCATISCIGYLIEKYNKDELGSLYEIIKNKPDRPIEINIHQVFSINEETYCFKEDLSLLKVEIVDDTEQALDAILDSGGFMYKGRFIVAVEPYFEEEDKIIVIKGYDNEPE